MTAVMLSDFYHGFRVAREGKCNSNGGGCTLGAVLRLHEDNSGKEKSDVLKRKD
jgi:hypothetical protein